MNFNKIPGPLVLPIWGNLYQYKFGIYNILEYHNVLPLLYKKYGPIVKEKYGKETIIHVFEPEDARTVYRNEGESPRTVPLQETIQLYRERKGMSLGLGNMNGDDWYRLRKAVRHLMLRPKDVQHFLPKLDLLGNDMIERISEDKHPQNHEVSIVCFLFH